MVFTSQRTGFEKQAIRNAVATSKQYQLYPQIIDPSLIKRARVEAQLRNSLPQQTEQESFLSTYYIELSDPDNF